MAKEPKVTNPTEEEQKEYHSLRDDDYTVAHIEGTRKTYKIHWLKPAQIEKLARLLVRKGKEDKDDESDALTDILHDAKIGCKAAAIYILNGFWSLKFKYWFLWRWFYYIRQYDNSQIMEILETGKKKVPLGQFLLLSMSLTEARGIVMNMRTEEAENIRHELLMEHLSQERKSFNG